VSPVRGAWEIRQEMNGSYELAETPGGRVAFAMARYNELHPGNASPDARDYVPYIGTFVEAEIEHAKVKWLGELMQKLEHLTAQQFHEELRQQAEKVIALRRECHNLLKKGA
jgi:hypothetical protein